jgi:arylsulfatase
VRPVARARARASPLGAYVSQWLQSFREFPLRQKPGSFNLEKVLDQLQQHLGSK